MHSVFQAVIAVDVTQHSWYFTYTYAHTPGFELLAEALCAGRVHGSQWINFGKNVWFIEF